MYIYIIYMNYINVCVYHIYAYTDCLYTVIYQLHVNMHIYTYINAHTQIYVCIYVSVYIYIYICIYFILLHIQTDVYSEASTWDPGPVPCSSAKTGVVGCSTKLALERPTVDRPNRRPWSVALRNPQRKRWNINHDGKPWKTNHSHGKPRKMMVKMVV